MRTAAHIGRNDPCPCGSGRKYKHCCLAGALQRSPAVSEQAWLRAAGEHLLAGRLTEAEALYEQILATDSDQPEALHMLGLIAYQTGRHEMAARLIERAIEVGPVEPSAHSNLGLVYSALGRTDDAIASQRRALRIDPRFATALNNLGIALLAKGLPEDAMQCFRSAVALKPDFADALNSLGRVLLDRGEINAAIEAFGRAIAAQGDHVLAHNNLGNALLALGASGDAVASYRRALEIRPEYVEAHYNLGMALRDWGKPEEAIEAFRAAVRLAPRFVEAHNGLGVALQECGRLDEARSSIRAALEAAPDYADAHFNLHTLLLDGGSDVTAAVQCLRRAVALRPADSTFRFFLGMLLDYGGDRPLADEQFARLAGGNRLDQARLAGWEWIRSSGKPLPPVTGSPIQALRIGLDRSVRAGLVMEFGVRFGTSIRQIAAAAGQTVHGFDSFRGLPADWHREPRGSYSTGGVLPAVPANVRLHAGWFENTLPPFLASNPGPVRFANIDCDLYESTATVLGLLADRIVPGSVLVFDECIGYENWLDDEYRAFKEEVARQGWRYEILCFSFVTRQLAVQIR
jgi:tetratricopeptide (TPR) repeat protein